MHGGRELVRVCRGAARGLNGHHGCSTVVLHRCLHASTTGDFVKHHTDICVLSELNAEVCLCFAGHKPPCCNVVACGLEDPEDPVAGCSPRRAQTHGRASWGSVEQARERPPSWKVPCRCCPVIHGHEHEALLHLRLHRRHDVDVFGDFRAHAAALDSFFQFGKAHEWGARHRRVVWS